MDGRRLQRWLLCGGLLVAGAGCKNQSLPNGLGTVQPGQSIAGIQVPGAKKSFWGSSSPQMPSAGLAPVEPIAVAKPKKTGPMPDFEAAAADLRVEQAFCDPPPPNRDELLDAARIRYQRALKANEKHKGALLGLARMYARIGDKDHMLEAYRDYLKHYPKDADVHHEIAQRMGQWKDWDSSMSWCEAALKLDPENRSYRKTLGFSLAMDGRWEEAFTALSGIMSEAQARHNLAGLLDHLGHRDACRQQLQMALQADPGFAPSREFLAELDGTARPESAGPAADTNPIRQAGGIGQ